MKALSIIRNEHQSIAAVLHGLLYLVGRIEQSGAKPDFELFGAMIYYIDAFPERFHHPKEDRYLFRALRFRHPECSMLIDQLQTEHELGAHKIRSLEQAMVRYKNGGSNGAEGFADAVRDYATFHWSHMRTEESLLLPLAEKWLTDEDWAVIDAAFTDHNDPLLGLEASKEFTMLFRRIVHMAPPPIGVGPAVEAPASARPNDWPIETHDLWSDRTRT